MNLQSSVKPQVKCLTACLCSDEVYVYVLHSQLKKTKQLTQQERNKNKQQCRESIELSPDACYFSVFCRNSHEHLMLMPKNSEEKFMGKFYFLFYRDLKRKSNQVQNCKAKIELLGTYDPQKQLIIEDPYYVCVRNSLGGLIKNCLCIVYNLSRSHS